MFLDLPVCNKKAEFLPFATALVSHLRSGVAKNGGT